LFQTYFSDVITGKIVSYTSQKSSANLHNNGQSWPLGHKVILNPFFPRLHSKTLLGLEIKSLDDKTCDCAQFHESEVLADAAGGTV